MRALLAAPLSRPSRVTARRVQQRSLPRLSFPRAPLRPLATFSAAQPLVLVATAAADTLLGTLSTPEAVALAVFAAGTAAFAASRMAATGVPSTLEAASVATAAAPQCQDGVIVFGAGGRLGREVVLSLMQSGSCVVAASRDANKTLATLSEAAAAAGLPAELLASRLFVRGGVDVTQPDTLTAELFADCTRVVSATGAVFGKNAAGQMGYIDNMTSERVDCGGNVNIASAAALHLTRPAERSWPPVVTFGTEAEVARWRRMDDVIMGGQSSSAWTVAAEGHGVWAGTLVLEGGGFCGCRCDGLSLDLSGSDGLVLRVRGDGQRYKLNLKTALNEGRSESTYQAVLDTASIPDGAWGDLRVAWHEFVAVVRQVEDPSAPPVDPATVRSLGFVLSRFEFNGLPNFAFQPGAFKLEVATIGAYALPRPQLVMISSAGVERNARIGDDAAARKRDIPIVQLNPGGVLNWKYKGESAFRFAAGGLRYAVVRPTGLDAGADTAAALEVGQGDVFAGKVSRAEVAAVTAVVLASPSVCTTFELRRSEAAIDAGKPSTRSDLERLLRPLVGDAGRTRMGLRPLPAPRNPPPPVTPQRKEEILARPDVQASLAAGRGGRTRGADEADAQMVVKSSAAEDASLWVANWRKKQEAETGAQ